MTELPERAIALYQYFSTPHPRQQCLMSPTIQNYDATRPEIEDVSQFQRILECDRFFSARSSVDLLEVSDDETCTLVTTQLVVF